MGRKFLSSFIALSGAVLTRIWLMPTINKLLVSGATLPSVRPVLCTCLEDSCPFELLTTDVLLLHKWHLL